MKIALYSYDIALITRWEKLLGKYETSILSSEDELLNLEKSLLIVSTDIDLKNINYIVKKVLENSNKILVLSRNPQFNDAQNWISKGINGYGNCLMSSSFLNSAVEAISKDYIWLAPHITTEFLKNMTNKQDKQDHEKLFENLSNAEKKVARLLKQGYTNMEISKELNISINTVKTHVKHIYEKLNVKDRLSFSQLFKN